MTFNARWRIEELANQSGTDIPNLLRSFLADFSTLVARAPIYLLDIAGNGYKFAIKYADGQPVSDQEVPSDPGFYSFFTSKQVLYVGEAGDLHRRLLEDPDNTADSTKIFQGQGRAILKYAMTHACTSDLQIVHPLVQTYSAGLQLPNRRNKTFGELYHLDNKEFRESFEGILKLVLQTFHTMMAAKPNEAGK